jgi:hypothetical protein
MDNFPLEAFKAAHPDITNTNPKWLYKTYLKSYGSWQAPPPPAPPPASVPVGEAGAVVAGTPKKEGDINVTDYASQVALDPSKALGTDDPATPQNESQFLADHQQNIDPNTAGTNTTAPQPTGPDPQAEAAQGTVTTAEQVDPREANSYDAQLSQQNIAESGQSTAAQGEVSDEALIDAPQLDMQGAGTGVNADGSVNQTGEALQQAAIQNISNIIDTSTPSGKALAEALGEGNYTDSKATLKGQLETLQSEFMDADGNPKIPGWAAGTARSVSKIAAFKGMSGTAATAAMSQALMEASIPIAQQDAQFFQTLTLQNLNNRQAQTLNRANVLAKFDLTNIDNRMAAAVENSKAFLAMDMANLDNAQQSEIINTQARVQSILEDSKQVNAQRLFTAESQNEMDKFYDTLNSSIQQYNSTQSNNMSQFNAETSNDTSKFNAEMENNRDQFYKNMQYNVDVANAKWRQAVTLQDNANAFEAAATDVKNMTTISQEQLNQIWDRSDALLDYAWKSSENDADRKNAVAIAKFQASAASKYADKQGMGAVIGSIAGKAAGALLDWAF